ncbi:uncharacterized protein LOC126939910 [Macaca thibetana thibetana]|uniref:uncharacterized protein LOC126939910 n=1 Tax=Macaca thibetana thibetana TaxID=257877 RepID=UPI0021BC5D72|nr:uncharacterized protein LOC126939910 [Macaca thibetana thibetana]
MGAWMRKQFILKWRLLNVSLREDGCLSMSGIGGFLVSLTSRMKPQTLAVNVTALKDGVSRVFPSGVQMCLELLPSGGFVVSLTGVKLQTFMEIHPRFVREMLFRIRVTLQGCEIEEVNASWSSMQSRDGLKLQSALDSQRGGGIHFRLRRPPEQMPSGWQSCLMGLPETRISPQSATGLGFPRPSWSWQVVSIVGAQIRVEGSLE